MMAFTIFKQPAINRRGTHACAHHTTSRYVCLVRRRGTVDESKAGKHTKISATQSHMCKSWLIFPNEFTSATWCKSETAQNARATLDVGAMQAAAVDPATNTDTVTQAMNGSKRLNQDAISGGSNDSARSQVRHVRIAQLSKLGRDSSNRYKRQA